MLQWLHGKQQQQNGVDRGASPALEHDGGRVPGLRGPASRTRLLQVLRVPRVVSNFYICIGRSTKLGQNIYDTQLADIRLRLF